MTQLAKTPVRNRIVLYFVLFIVAPSLVMGALAYRGVKNDQALTRQHNQERALADGAGIVAQTQLTLDEIEEEFLQTADSHMVAWRDRFPDSSLVAFMDAHRAVRGIVYTEEDMQETYTYPLQYLPRPVVEKEVVPFTVPAAFEPALAYEFQQKDYEQALAIYESVMREHPDISARAAALNAIARLFKKMHRYAEALEAYALLDSLYADMRIGLIPIGLIADAERGTVLLEVGDTARAIAARIDLGEHLLQRTWRLDEGTYFVFLEKVHGLVQNRDQPVSGTTGHLRARLDSLAESLEKHAAETAQLLTVAGTIRQRKSVRSPPRERWREKSGDAFLVSTLPTRQGVWLILYSQDIILEQHIAPLLEQMTLEGRLHWAIVDPAGEVLFHSEHPVEGTEVARLDFPQHMPGWILVAYSKSPSTFQAFISSGQGMYFYIFLFIGAVLITGLFFIIYTINRELTLTKIKSEFITTVSHELKSPLTSIRQITEMLQRGRVPAEMRDKYYGIMLQQGTRLSHQIDNILDYSKLEQGGKTFTFTEEDIGHLIRSVVDAFDRSYKDKALDIHVDIQENIPEIPVDKRAIEQTLNNLIDNAIKFSGKSKYIEISARQEHDRLAIAIRDHGIGIPQKDQSRIFDRFYRAKHGEAHYVAGSGIGLSLVKENIAAHGGHIVVESRPGEGSTFYIYLPLKNGALP